MSLECGTIIGVSKAAGFSKAMIAACPTGLGVLCILAGAEGKIDESTGIALGVVVTLGGGIWTLRGYVDKVAQRFISIETKFDQRLQALEARLEDALSQKCCPKCKKGESHERTH